MTNPVPPKALTQDLTFDLQNLRSGIHRLDTDFRQDLSAHWQRGKGGQPSGCDLRRTVWHERDVDVLKEAATQTEPGAAQKLSPSGLSKEDIALKVSCCQMRTENCLEKKEREVSVPLASKNSMTLTTPTTFRKFLLSP